MSFVKVNRSLLTIFFLVSFNLFSQVDPVLQENKVRADNAAISQEKIDSSPVKIDQDSSEYKGVTKQREGLKVYKYMIQNPLMPDCNHHIFHLASLL